MVVLLSILPFFLFITCSEKSEIVEGELKKVHEIVINDNNDQVGNIMEGLQAVESKELLYGIDFIARRPFKISVKTGEVQYLSSKGKGPKELSLPSQVTVKNDDEFFIYDTTQDLYAHFINDEIIDKYPGLLEQRIWLRNTYGEFWNNYLITGIVDPEKINSMNFKEARALSFYNLETKTAELKGTLSPTIDKLDNAFKSSVIALDEVSESVFYAFLADYTVMKYDIKDDSTHVFSTYKPSKMRTRTLSVDYNRAPTPESAKAYGLDNSGLIGLEVIEHKLVVIWQNATPEFYEERGASNLLKNYFGVIYDLEENEKPVEITLPGKLLGSYNNRLMVEEDDNLDNYTIGFYEIVE